MGSLRPTSSREQRRPQQTTNIRDVNVRVGPQLLSHRHEVPQIRRRGDEAVPTRGETWSE